MPLSATEGAQTDHNDLAGSHKRRRGIVTETAGWNSLSLLYLILWYLKQLEQHNIVQWNNVLQCEALVPICLELRSAVMWFCCRDCTFAMLTLKASPKNLYLREVIIASHACAWRKISPTRRCQTHKFSLQIHLRNRVIDITKSRENFTLWC